MLDQNVFTETLKEVAEIIRTSATPMSKEEILGYFKDMELSAEQEEMVFTYLSTPHEEETSSEQENEDAFEDEAENEEAEPQDEDALEALATESRVFQMYMEEVAALPSMSAEEMNDLYHRLQSGDASVVAQITQNWLPQVLQASKKYFKAKVNLEDVIQEGNIGLFVKLTELVGTSFDMMKIQLELDRAMRDAMKAYISEMSGEEDSEETIAGKANLVAQAKKTLADTNGTEPGIAELSAYTHMSEEELEDILNLMAKAEKAKESTDKLNDLRK